MNLHNSPIRRLRPHGRGSYKYLHALNVLLSVIPDTDDFGAHTYLLRAHSQSFRLLPHSIDPEVVRDCKEGGIYTTRFRRRFKLRRLGLRSKKGDDNSAKDREDFW